MPQLALAAAGAWVGSTAITGTIFGMTGASIGWMVGSALGSMLTPGSHTEGPRVGDLTVTSSTLGTPMTLLYGTARIGGNVIAASEIREVGTTTSQGKGGGSSSTSYTYNVDLAIDLCQGPAAGIRRIWSDGKLVYDVSAESGTLALMTSGGKAPAFKFYPGSEAQLPDPTLEAIYGVGNVPAYRGRCYVVFAQIDCPGGRIPQLTFEVVKDGSFGTGTVVALHHFDNAGTLVFEGSSPIWPGYKGTFTDVKGAIGPVWKIADFTSTTPATYGKSGVNEQGATLGRVGLYFTPYVSSPIYSCYATLDGSFAAAGDFTIEFIWNSKGHSVYGSVNNFFLLSAGGGKLTVRNVYSVGGRAFSFYVSDGIKSESFSTAPLLEAGVNSGNVRIAITRKANTYRIFINGVLKQTKTGTLVTLPGSGLISLCGKEQGAHVIPNDYGTGAYGEFMFVNGLALYTADYTPATAPYPASNTISVGTSNAVTLASIIADQAQRAGLSAGQIDVAGISDTVIGYPIARGSSARANLEPLLQAFFIDAVEIDGKIKFTKRANQAQAAVIAFDELAAGEGDGEAPDPLPLARTQDAELPRSITVQYMDVAADYQPGAERALRQITSSANDMPQDLPIATTAAHAKQVADVLLFDAWSGRNARSGKLTRKFAHLTPGDVVSVEYPPGEFRQRLLTKVNDTGSLIEFDAIDANAEIYQVAPPGAAGSSGQSVDLPPGPTMLQPLDIPILRDADDNAGVYVALANFGAVWRGGELYAGPSDGALEFRGSTTTAAALGTAETALGNWTSNTMDETNTLVVNIGPGLLAGTTRDAVIDGTVNACAIGQPGRWEIVQFVRATSLGGNRWEISGLKRGQRGTESNRSNHAAGDVFSTLVPVSLLRPGFDLAELNQPRRLRAISAGLPLDSAESVAAVNTGVGLRPLSPIDLRGTRAAGDLTITWGRRSRLTDNWLAGLVPLGETSEAYEVEVWTAGFAALKRTITSAARSVVYTSAQQVTDFGSAQASLSLRVFQMSSTVGRGSPLQGTV